MAYGQTGAGKTFTMTGDTGNYRLRGIIPRAVSQVITIYSYCVVSLCLYICVPVYVCVSVCPCICMHTCIVFYLHYTLLGDGIIYPW